MEANWHYPSHFRWFYINELKYVAMCSTCDAASSITKVGDRPDGWLKLESPYRFICPGCKEN